MCDLNYAGPLYCKGSSKKHYILLYTCVTAGRIHLKLTSLWNLPDCIHAFRKIAARRGVPTGVYSDNACTLVAAATEPTGLYGIHTPTWRKIVQHSPWRGGWWEQLSCSVKPTCHKTVGNRSLTQVSTKVYPSTRGVLWFYIKLPSDLGKGPLTPTFLSGQPQVEYLEIHDLLDMSTFLFWRSVT